MKMYSLLTEGDTAATETALCENCFNEENRAYAREQASQSDDVLNFDEFVDFSNHETLECCICGKQAGEA